MICKKKMIAAICVAALILASIGFLKERATVHPDSSYKMVGVHLIDEPDVVDGGCIMGQDLGATNPFAFELSGCF